MVIASPSDGVRQYSVCIDDLRQHLVLDGRFARSGRRRAGVWVVASKQGSVCAAHFRRGGLRVKVQHGI